MLHSVRYSQKCNTRYAARLGSRGKALEASPIRPDGKEMEPPNPPNPLGARANPLRPLGPRSGCSPRAPGPAPPGSYAVTFASASGNRILLRDDPPDSATMLRGV